MKQSDPRTAGNAPATKWGEGAQLASASWGPAVPGREMDVPGASSQTLTGEIGLSEFENVFAEVSICPETTKLHPESLRETHFEGTVTCFEFAWPIGWKSRTGKGPSWHPPAGVRGGLTVCRNGGRGPVGIRQLGSGRPRPRNGRT